MFYTHLAARQAPLHTVAIPPAREAAHVIDGLLYHEADLCRRYRKLARARKQPTVITAAIARELAGFIWAIAKQVQPMAT